MQILLDTHVVLWALSGDDRLDRRAVELITDGRSVVFVSAVSVWEITVKRSLGKLRAPTDVVGAIDRAGFEHLPLSLQHAEAVAELPPHHRDPFDRMLVAQARCDQLTLMTHDAAVQRYDVQLLVV